MVIGRGRRREYPNKHFVLLLRKKVEEKIRGGGKYGGIIREKSTGKIRGGSTGKKVRGKVTSLPVTSLPVKHAQWSDPLDPPQMRLCPCPYTTCRITL